MSTWLDIVASELELASVEPGDPLEPGVGVTQNDHEVGCANDAQRRLFIMATRWQKEGLQSAVDAKFIRNLEEAQRLSLRAIELKVKSEILKNIF